jgi:hypothetical protein
MHTTLLGQVLRYNNKQADSSLYQGSGYNAMQQEIISSVEGFVNPQGRVLKKLDRQENAKTTALTSRFSNKLSQYTRVLQTTLQNVDKPLENCATEDDPNCSDNQCYLWSTQTPSECQNNPNYMLSMCPIACKAAGFDPQGDGSPTATSEAIAKENGPNGWRMWPNTEQTGCQVTGCSCQDMQNVWKTCTNNSDPNYATVIEHCPATCEDTDSQNTGTNTTNLKLINQKLINKSDNMWDRTQQIHSSGVTVRKGLHKDRKKTEKKIHKLKGQEQKLKALLKGIIPNEYAHSQSQLDSNFTRYLLWFIAATTLGTVAFNQL